MKDVVIVLLLVLGCAPLGGCGAFVAGAAGGLAAGAVIENSHRPPPPAFDPRYEPPVLPYYGR